MERSTERSIEGVDGGAEEMIDGMFGPTGRVSPRRRRGGRSHRETACETRNSL